MRAPHLRPYNASFLDTCQAQSVQEASFVEMFLWLCDGCFFSFELAGTCIGTGLLSIGAEGPGGGAIRGVSERSSEPDPRGRVGRVKLSLNLSISFCISSHHITVSSSPTHTFLQMQESSFHRVNLRSLMKLRSVIFQSSIMVVPTFHLIPVLMVWLPEHRQRCLQSKG